MAFCRPRKGCLAVETNSPEELLAATGKKHSGIAALWLLKGLPIKEGGILWRRIVNDGARGNSVSAPSAIIPPLRRVFGDSR